MKKWIFLAAVLGFLGLVYLIQDRGITTYTATREKKTKEESKPLLFVGDVMMGRYVEKLANDEKDEMRSFRNVQNFLKEHITIANLEGPIPLDHQPTPQSGMVFSFPSSTPQVLKDGGITAVSLANNHMYDRGKNGEEETIYALEKVGMNHFGGYAPEVSFFQTKLGDENVIVFGLSMISSLWDEAKALEVAHTLRNDHPDAHVIAFMHWGDEYVIQNRYQRAFAHQLIDAGVDTVVGAHPHVVQGVEVYNGKPVFYSLGNFIFDQYWRKDLENGYMLKISDNNPLVYEIIPIHSHRSIPYIATSTKRDEILSSISSQSDDSLKEDILSGRLQVYK